MKKFRVGIIGLGNQACQDHIPGVLNSKNAEIVAVCDIDEHKTREYEHRLGVNGYVSYIDMIDNEAMDFVVVATPHWTHREIVKCAAERGVHILKEKPFADNFQDALFMNDVCNANHVQLMVTLQRRFNPIFNTFFQLIDQIGNISLIEAKYTLFVRAPHDGWRGKKETAGGGCILDMGYHSIDMILWYFGLPQSVCAEFSSVCIDNNDADVEDEALIIFNYDDKINGSLILSRYYSPKTEYIKVVGNRGIIEVERGKIVRYSNDGTIIESLTRENSWPTAASDQVDFFCKVISGEKENLNGPEKHLEHMAFIEACYDSKKEGRKINPREIIAKWTKQN